MTDFPMDDDLARRIQALAEQEQRSPNDVLRAMLEQYTPTPPRIADQPEKPSWGQRMAKIIREDTTDVFDGFSPDLSARSREILENEYAHYLLKRTDSC